MFETASFSPDGRYVVTGSWDSAARITEIENGRVVYEIKHNSPVHAAAFSPDGRYVVTGSFDGVATITDLTKE